MVMVLAKPAANEQNWQQDSNNLQNNDSNIIKELRSLVQAEKGLTCSTSDEFLIRFIKASQYNLKQSHLLVKEYFLAKAQNEDYFVVQSPMKNVDILERYDLGHPLKGFDLCGRRILYIRLGDVDPAKESWSKIFQSMIMTLEAYSMEEDVQNKGIAMILDTTNFTLKIMKWATPHKMKLLMGLLQECIPIRFEMIHIVNAPLVFNIFFTALKPFMNENFKRKLHWHRGDCKSLEQHMDRDILPLSLGGTLDIGDVRNWYQIVLDKEDDFTEIRKMGYNVTANSCS